MRMRIMLPTVGLFTMLLTGQALADPVVVACGPGQRAIVRNTFMRGEPVTRVSCVEREFRPATYREPYSTRYRPAYTVRRHRSWGKSALVIGGSTATGAGIGGIVGGGKGALLGPQLAAAPELSTRAHTGDNQAWLSATPKVTASPTLVIGTCDQPPIRTYPRSCRLTIVVIAQRST